jgi:hypothetical protein
MRLGFYTISNGHFEVLGGGQGRKHAIFSSRDGGSIRGGFSRAMTAGTLAQSWKKQRYIRELVKPRPPNEDVLGYANPFYLTEIQCTL